MAMRCILARPDSWARDAFAVAPENFPAGLPAYRHIGIYAYRPRS